jgi:5-methylcytosine-specific restriction protein A
MPTAPPRPCSYGPCGRLVPGGGRCQAHKRPSAAARGYTAGWARYARAWLRQFPLCGTRQDGRRYPVHSQCVRRGLDTPARVVDHIRSIAAGGDVFDPSNHQSLCVACNTRKG